jgi:phospholipid/cholesterol/gamma-HCH transport system substrate-binding protein
MAKGRSYFLVGLFVIVGVFIGVAAIVWLGASNYFQKGSMYVTYFDESVQGLQVDSIVKYRGVDVGRVREVGIAPDRRLVEVVMKIDAHNFSVSGVAARLTLAGITGIVYVELDRKKQNESSMSPKGFTPPYPVIPSAPSDIKQIEATINDVLNNLKQIDFKGISDQIRKTANSIDVFVSGERTSRIMANLSKASANLVSLSERIDTMMSDGGSVSDVIRGARDTLREARAVIAQVKGEIDGVKLGQTAGKVDRLVEDTSGRVQATMTEVEITAETLRHTADSLEALIDRLNGDPSLLIFSRPPKGE